MLLALSLLVSLMRGFMAQQVKKVSQAKRKDPLTDLACLTSIGKTASQLARATALLKLSKSAGPINICFS